MRSRASVRMCVAISRSKSVSASASSQARARRPGARSPRRCCGRRRGRAALPAAAACRWQDAACARRLVLAEEDADVLLVLLRLEVVEEGDDPLVAARARREEQLAVRVAELAPGRVDGDPLLLRELGERAALVVVARLGPRIDRAVAQGALGVRDDERLVVLERGAEAVAGGAGAAGIVEGEELRASGRGRCRGPRGIRSGW